MSLFEQRVSSHINDERMLEWVQQDLTLCEVDPAYQGICEAYLSRNQFIRELLQSDQSVTSQGQQGNPALFGYVVTHIIPNFTLEQQLKSLAKLWFQRPEERAELIQHIDKVYFSLVDCTKNKP